VMADRRSTLVGCILFLIVMYAVYFLTQLVCDVARVAGPLRDHVFIALVWILTVLIALSGGEPRPRETYI